MQTDIHPDYHEVIFRDLASGKSFLTRSTVTSSKTDTWEDGNEYPLVEVHARGNEISLTGDAEQVHAARRLIAAGAALVLTTAGAKGATAHTRAHRVTVPAARTRVADTIGAGDSVHGALLTKHRFFFWRAVRGGVWQRRWPSRRR